MMRENPSTPTISGRAGLGRCAAALAGILAMTFALCLAGCGQSGASGDAQPSSSEAPSPASSPVVSPASPSGAPSAGEPADSGSESTSAPDEAESGVAEQGPTARTEVPGAAGGEATASDAPGASYEEPAPRVVPPDAGTSDGEWVCTPAQGHWEKKLVADAWDEQYPHQVEFTQCSICGADMTGNSDHIRNAHPGQNGCAGTNVRVEYETIHHDAIYEDIWVIDVPEHWEQR